MLVAHDFARHRNLRHGFFTRRGGVSFGCYASMNCGFGSGDAPHRVETNRGRAMSEIGFPPHALVTARQVHSGRAIVVTEAWQASQRPEVDGLATRVPGLALGVLTADCAPVLFADAQASVIGAAHAGWRGAKGGVLEATIEAMEALGACRSRMETAIGPCIRQASYEVTKEFEHDFARDEPDAAQFFCPGMARDRSQFDLPGYVGKRLVAAGIAALSILPYDTCSDSERFFSYRRVTLERGGDYGRQLSVIALLP